MRREITKQDLEQVQVELRWVCQHNQDGRPPSVLLEGRDGPETHSVIARSPRQQRNSRNSVSKDTCGSVVWKIKLQLIIYFSTHLWSFLEIRPHGSKVKVTSCTCERLVWWTLPRQSIPSSQLIWSPREEKQSVSTRTPRCCCKEYCGRDILSIGIDESVTFHDRSMTFQEKSLILLDKSMAFSYKESVFNLLHLK